MYSSKIVTNPINNGYLLHNNGQNLFIKQPNIMEVKVLYEAIMANKKTVYEIFKDLNKH